MAGRQSGGDNAPMAVGRAVDGPGILEQIHQSVSIRLLGRLFLAVAAGPAAFAPARTVAGAVDRALCSLPVVIWNRQHHWITVAHVASDGQLGQEWHRTYCVGEFLLRRLACCNPVFFAARALGGRGVLARGPARPLPALSFSAWARLCSLLYFLLSFHSHILANWIAPSVIPLFCLMAVYWWKRWGERCHAAQTAAWHRHRRRGRVCGRLGARLESAGKLVHRRKLPARLDMLHRVRGWKEMAQIVGQARQEAAAQGPPAFIICEHYGFTSQITFYLPEAKSRVSSDPLVFFYATPSVESVLFLAELSQPPRPKRPLRPRN